MDEKDHNESRLDRWIRRAKDNPALAIILMLGVIIGALGSFTDSLKSLASLFKHEQATVATATPAIRLFQSRPEEIQVGDAAMIEWNVDSADSVRIDGDIGAVPLTGNHEIRPSKTTTYTLTATNHGVDVTSNTTIRVVAGPAFEGILALNDVFEGDGGWKQLPDSVFRGSIGGGRFRMEWIENRSARCVTRDVSLGSDKDFSIQVTAQLVQLVDSGYALGLCWGDSGGQATYMLYLYPGSASPCFYQFVRDEMWQQTTADGHVQPYGHSVNLLDPADVNHKFQSTAIRPGTAANVITVVRRGDKLRIFVNGEYIDQVTYPRASVDRVGMFIGGQLAAEFRELSVRIAK